MQRTRVGGQEAGAWQFGVAVDVASRDEQDRVHIPLWLEGHTLRSTALMSQLWSPSIEADPFAHVESGSYVGKGGARYPLHSHPGMVKFRKPLTSDSLMALPTPFPNSILSKRMRSSHTIVSV
jgi:hypothetical protein